MGLIRLSDAINNLREELKLAQESGKNQNLQFNVGSIELELEVLIEQEESGNAKINWWILAGGAEAKVKGADKHKLKLTLQAVDAKGQPLKVSKIQEELPD